MAISKEKKKGIIDNLKSIISDSGSIVFVNFHGLTVNDTTNVRKAFKEKGVRYLVAKKSLARKVLGESKIEGSAPSLEGELGLVYGKDLIEPARETYSFQKKLENKISILGGIFEKRFVDKSEMVSIAQIPSMLTLQAQFVNIINSPIQGFVTALGEIAKKKA
jgi:large subunit ribosomal protein L10